MTENYPREFDAVLGGKKTFLDSPFSNAERFTGFLLRLNPVANAILSSYGANNNSHEREQISAGAWTISGELNLARSLIKFDIPLESRNYKLLFAQLFLFAETIHPLYGQGVYNREPVGHSQMTGSNQWLLSPVVSAWNDKDVTWNTQPKTMSISQLMPASRSFNQNYENIDITSLVRACLEQKINYGFLMKLETETPYRQVTFHSRNTEQLDLKPRLDLYYI